MKYVKFSNMKKKLNIVCPAKLGCPHERKIAQPFKNLYHINKEAQLYDHHFSRSRKKHLIKFNTQGPNDIFLLLLLLFYFFDGARV
jgi:hypothetical protein